MKNKLTLYILAILIIPALQSCFIDDDKNITNDIEGNFEQLWTIVDEHSCFFEYKKIDWASIHTVYYNQLDSIKSTVDFFDLCADMLSELKDGHVNLYGPFDTSHNWSWKEDYPENYDERIVHEHYLNFDYRSSGGMVYKVLPQNIGYIYYGSFSSTFSESLLDYILTFFEQCDGIIIDIRNNGGGLAGNVDKLACRFTDNEIMTGYSMYKNGPGHNDFSQPRELYLTQSYRIKYTRPVVVLTNRGSFSAANDFVRVMSTLPNVTTIGDTTGGGSGIPVNYYLSCGLIVRLSSNPILNIDGEHTEFGIEPDIKVDMDANAQLTGRDAILDRAIQHLTKQ